ncbi:iron complex outermembrane receptor protein [Luteimonas cucumeris]|uniref:Iron complex outermembrane receptor protein n=1 Tax=Luteimonas cucumeris TaxID=985012 RepID=A0A562LF13_9GAMM|nr:TonB-dependent receptor [Luteimonas cucumeris]TWI06196.1 iron complex outermembrane receptor protein [Luteimonas cucumeris]
MSLNQHILALSLRRAIIGACVLPFATAAWAQDAVDADTPPPAQQSAAQAPSTNSAVTLDTVVVTAQSREQQLQDVPIALQVVNEQLLQDITAEDMGDLDAFVPGLVVGSTQPTQPSFQLRGISTGDFGIGTDPAVGVYVDGVYAGRGGGTLLPFTDVERIEILKGPQGTLFGRNSAAGAVSIITRRPTSQVEGHANLRVGNHGKRYLEAMLNAPADDKIAFRMNALVNRSDGWLQDAATGVDLNPEDNWATRAAFRMDVSEATQVLLSWDHENLDQKSRPSTGIVSLPASPGLPMFPVDTDAYLDPRDQPTYSDVIDNEESRRFNGVTLIVDHATGWGSFTSTSAWRGFDTVNRAEEDATNRRYLYIDTANRERNSSWYQEFKFAGSSDRIDWVAGASYYQESARQSSEVNLFSDSVDSAMVQLGAVPPTLPIPPGMGPFGFGQMLLDANGIPLNLLGNPWNEAYQNTLDSKAYALYGDVIWHATDKLNLTFGLRYTRDEKDFSWFNDHRSAPELDATLYALEQMGVLAMLGITAQDLMFDLAFTDPVSMANKGIITRDSNSWSDVSPRFVADYHLNDNAMVFASLAKGYKAGGFNSFQPGASFDNEDVWNFETGIKQSLPQYRLEFDASAYYYVYDNRQAIRLDTTGDIPRYITDTSDQEAYGLDFAARWQATEAFGLDFNAAFIDASYKDYVTPEGTSLNGQPTGEPYWSFAAGANYVWELGDGSDIRFSLRHAYRGARRCSDESLSQGTCAGFPAFEVGGAQNRSDLRASWTSSDDRWGVAMYGTNVFDNRYVTGLHTYGTDVFGTTGATVSEPRFYGVELSAKF